MFENIVGHNDSEGKYKVLLAQGHFVGTSHYVIILYGSDGTLLDVNVSDLTEQVVF